jgi:serine/threonine protein kinase
MPDREKREGPTPGAGRRRQRESAGDRSRIGSVIAGSYRIDEFLGRGAIGAVFGGMHLRLERRVAIKFVDPTLVDDQEIRARFKREAKICAQIGSSHAVEVFDYGVGEDGAPYLVMERLVGEDLHHKLLREGPVPVDRALRIAKQVCRALGAAHGNGIVHRDLKPENVFLVDRDGEKEFVKVVDFGLSTFVQSDDTRLTRAGQSVGTPLYMAPEQAGAHAFDARVDVYSLGVLIFEMTTGRLPFEANTLQALLVALATQPPRSIRQYNPRLPIELDDLVLRFIARDPRVRPKTAAAALAEILALEERLLAKSAETASTQRAKPTPSGRPPGAYDHGPSRTAGTSGLPRLPLAIDGLPGQLSSEFEGEVSSHLTELRRTGRLATSDVIGEPDAAPETAREPAPNSDAPVTDPLSTPLPYSTTGDMTRPMARREIDEMMSDPSIPHEQKRPSTRPSPMGRELVTATSESGKMRRVHEEMVEEDSQVFYGRVKKGEGAAGSPGPISIRELPKGDEPARVTHPPPRPRGKGPPMLILFIALVAFLVVAALVVLRALRG